mmetsp:Transcript_8839/g.14812  ORF Transcript_8839/g.14812 Transcript_8839/m.14812 type:complete len:181 (-) Transcript_8839:169-711(-)|eukprot:CAMPEP_0119316492 /NCGR_PEP_ID=MMETSP1333-20130426/39792_1 /TAXON_ID=418940 /ORGANISM="Scyphosphaera apsteinii, Strain RCC1455" /LENGTH=180 /DNA_ID=CAMNT_0007322151 /DNA_START=126 /DNA_END=668 /DNA_ORIENTATION=+
MTVAAEADPLAAAQARGTDVAALQRLAALGDKEGVTALLKAEGYKTGARLKLEGALFVAAALPTRASEPTKASIQPYQVDFFGVKRGGCPPDCSRYEGNAIVFNACSMPGGPEILNCMRCGKDPGQHENLGAWESGQPMLINENGQRFKTISKRTLQTSHVGSAPITKALDAHRSMNDTD